MFHVAGPVVEGERQKDSPTTRHWQAQIDNSFDALLGFASSELDRTRELRRRSSDHDRPLTAMANCLEPGQRLKDHRLPPQVAIDPRDPNYARSDSRSDSRDSGLGKDSEGDVVDRLHAAVAHAISMEGIKSGAGAGPPDRISPRVARHANAPGSLPTSKSPGLNNSTDSLNTSNDPDLLNHRDIECPSPSRARSRSRSPLDKDSGDKYSNYDRHFKKKFFKMKSATQKSPPSSPLEGKYGKFRPKGKDWEKNQKGECGLGELSSGSRNNSGAMEQAESDTPTKAPRDKVKAAESGDNNQGPHGSKTADSRHSAFSNVSQQRASSAAGASSEVSRPHSSSSPFTAATGSTPQGTVRPNTSTPSSTHSGPTAANHSGPHSTSGRSSVPTAGPPSVPTAGPPVRPPPDMPHSTFAELAAQASMGQGAFAHQALTEALSRGHAPPPHLISGGLMAHPPFDFEGSRMAMLAELAGHRGPGFSVSFGGPPTFRPPFGAEFGPRQALIADFPMTRPPFSDVATGQRAFNGDSSQMFSPMSRSSKEKGWQAFGNGAASSKQ